MAIEVFNRYEHKYLLDKKTFQQVILVMDEHMEMDKYNKNHTYYTISNLYLDTPDNYLIRQSLSKPQYKEKLRHCSAKAMKKREELSLNIEKTEEEIKALIPELKKQKRISDKELDIVCGWYFYSESHINRIIKYIDSGVKPIQYQKMVKILSAPEKFVSEIHMFEKGEKI